MKGHMENGKFHPHSTKKGVRKARGQSSKFVGLKIHPDERAREQLKGAPQSIKVCSTCDRSFDISKQKGNDFFALPQCPNCKRRGVPPL